MKKNKMKNQKRFRKRLKSQTIEEETKKQKLI